MYRPSQILESIYRATPAGIGIVVDRKFKEVNAQICQMLGYDEEELIGQSARMLYESDEEFERVGREKYAQIEKCGTGSVETCLLTKDGRKLHIHLSSTPVDSEDSTKGYLFTATDISAQIAAQKETDKIIGSMGNVIATRTEWLNENNRKLQSEIDKRSSIEMELRASKKELEETVDKLQQTQSQIIQSEKMASIGQLAAGVAHEINNPTAFVNSNLNTMAQYQEQMAGLLQKYETMATALDKVAATNGLPQEISTLVAETRCMAEEIDLEFLKEDYPELIAESREGTERIRKIVADLKDFAHPGDQSLKETDINQGLDSTINIVWNEIKYKSQLTKDYADLPPVLGYSQQINQVFMNLLVNAAHAIDKDGLIHVSTHLCEDAVEIRICDNGNGIPEEIRSKIFDPFFTTKDIGEGTGLGLSLAYSIIEKHHGTIEVESEMNQGTTFTIRLPAVSMGDGDTICCRENEQKIR